jgi:tRNA-specific 2-thiouridylase
VRRIAAEAGLANAAKKDSTGICFIGERKFREFLSRYLPKQPGEIRRLDDERVIGRHEGLAYYTLGQREGLGIGGVKGAPEEPWFVAAKDMDKNVLYAVQGHDHPALLRERLTAGQLSWIAGKAPHTHWVYAAKTRYRMPDAACDIESLADDRCEVAFAAPQWAVTPGQSVVLYESHVCLGGGIIL